MDGEVSIRMPFRQLSHEIQSCINVLGVRDEHPNMHQQKTGKPIRVVNLLNKMIHSCTSDHVLVFRPWDETEVHKPYNDDKCSQEGIIVFQLLCCV